MSWKSEPVRRRLHQAGWLFFVSAASVLLLGCNPEHFVLNVFGGEDAEGATVFVNGAPVGSLQKSGDKEVRFATKLPYGTLTVEVKKERFSFRQVITVSPGTREHTIHVALSLEQKTNEEKKNGEEVVQPSPMGDRPAPICPD